MNDDQNGLHEGLEPAERGAGRPASPKEMARSYHAARGASIGSDGGIAGNRTIGRPKSDLAYSIVTANGKSSDVGWVTTRTFFLKTPASTTASRSCPAGTITT